MVVLQPRGEDVFLQGVVLLQDGLVLHLEGEGVLLLQVKVVLILQVARREVVLHLQVEVVLLLRGEVLRPI